MKYVIAVLMIFVLSACGDGFYIEAGLDEDGHLMLTGITFADEDGNIVGKAVKNDAGDWVLSDVVYSIDEGEIIAGISVIDGKVVLDNLTVTSMGGRFSASASTNADGEIVLTRLVIGIKPVLEERG